MKRPRHGQGPARTVGRSPKPTKVYLFDPDHLEPGDVVLERGRGLISAGVATITRGSFSHALMWIDGTDFIEAMPTGVRVLSYARVPVTNPKNWRLLRPTSEHRLKGKLAADAARNMAFKTYDGWGAGLTVAGGRSIPNPRSLFCSQLVARAYQEAGLELLPSTTPEQFSPNDLARSTHLHEVQPVFREHIVGDDYPIAFLDRSRAFTGSGPDRQGEVDRLVFHSGIAEWRAQSATIDPKLSEPGNLSELLTALQAVGRPARDVIAERTRKAMHLHGYFNLADEGLAQIFDRLAAGHDYTDQLKGWRHSRDRFIANAATSRSISIAMSHELWGDLAEMYERLGGQLAALIDHVERSAT